MNFRGMLAALAAMFGTAHGSAVRRSSPSPYPERVFREEGAGKHSGGRFRSSQKVAAAGSRLSFRPLGSPLTLKVSKGLRWGHMSRERRIRLSNLAARKSAA